MIGGCFSAIGAGCFLIGVVAEQDSRYLVGAAGLGVIACLLLLVYSKLRDTVEFDFTNQFMSFKRRLGPWHFSKDKMSFKFLHAIVVSPAAKLDHRNGPLSWSYGIAVVTKDGRLIKLTEENQLDFGVAETAGRRLSKRVDCPFFPTQRARYLKISSKFPPEISLQEPESGRS